MRCYEFLVILESESAMSGAGITVFCFLASYVVALGVEAAGMLKRVSGQRPVVLIAATAGLFAHTWYLFERSTTTQLPPLLSSTHDWLLVLAWIAILFYLVISLTERELSIGLFLLPMVLLLIAAAKYVSYDPNSALVTAKQSAIRGWAMLHASLLVFGIAGVIIGFVLSLMYLFQHRRLKQKHAASRGVKLPSLERLSRWNWWSVMLSVPLLSLGMLTGVILGLSSDSEIESLSFGDPVVLISGIAWIVMIVFFIWLIRAQRTAGKLVAWRTLWAFGFLLVTLIGLQVLTSGGSLSIETWHT